MAETTLDLLDPASEVLSTDIIYTKDASSNDLKATMQQVKDFVKPADASINQSGLVNTASQAFSGKKTFSGGIAATSAEVTSLSVSNETLKIHSGEDDEISVGVDSTGDAIIGPTGSEKKIPTVSSFGSAGQVLGIGSDGTPAFMTNTAEAPIYFAVCNTAADTQTKQISIPSLVNLQTGIEISVLFSNANTYGSCAGTSSNVISDGVKLSLNDGTAYPIKVGGENAGEGFNRAGDVHTFVFDGSAWNDMTSDVIYQGSTSAGNYVKKRNGFITEKFRLINSNNALIYSDNQTVDFFVPFTEIPFFNVYQRYEYPSSGTTRLLLPGSVTVNNWKMKRLNAAIGDLQGTASCFSFEGY